jgi:transcriptional regulator with XRE-family HTH domain
MGLPVSMPRSPGFPQILTKLRKEASLSQHALALELKTSPNCISNWERGVVSPSLYNVEKVATYFGYKWGLIKI